MVKASSNKLSHLIITFTLGVRDYYSRWNAEPKAWGDEIIFLTQLVNYRVRMQSFTY